MTENLAHPQFSKGLSGYKVEEVDSYIDKVLDTIKDLKDQNEVLEEKIGVLAESLQKYREDEDSLREALLGAQKMGDSIVKNANNKAEITMREASVKAAHIVEEARKKVEDEKDELIRVQARAPAPHVAVFQRLAQDRGRDGGKGAPQVVLQRHGAVDVGLDLSHVGISPARRFWESGRKRPPERRALRGPDASFRSRA